MAANNLLAKKYSVAAFGLAKKLNLLDVFEADLGKFVGAFSKVMLKELSNPAISREDLQKVVAELGAKLELNQNVINFLTVIAEQRRINNIAAITKSFSKLVKAEKNILEADVISAVDLDANSVAEIKDVLAKKYAGKAIKLNQIVKKDILGGVQIKIGSVLIDASLKQQLANLNKQFQSIL